MTRLPFSKIRNSIFFIAFLIIAGGIGYNLGKKQVTLSFGARPVIHMATPESESVDFSLFWDVWQKVHTMYIDRDQIDNEDLVYGAIGGMVSSLQDPYTTFLPPRENQDFKDDMNGSFEGIGAQLGLQDGRIIIVSPLKGSPAERSGIKPSDLVDKVDGTDTTGWTVEEAVGKIRGKKGTSVALTILRVNVEDPLEISIVRDEIVIPAVVSWVKKTSEIEEISAVSGGGTLSDAYIGYISLSRFGDRLTSEWSTAVDLLVRDSTIYQAKGIIFDLRSNPGGYLDGSVFIASEFLKDGKIVSQKNTDGTSVDYSVNRKGQLVDTPVIVLINKGSASASEIVAGALKDHKRATIVGETSFGKGSVQTPEEFSGGSSLHVTTGRWYTPSGTSISKTGITPDFIVELGDAPEASADAQLYKAIELLLK